MAHKVAEKLIILKDVGNGLMCRLHALIGFDKTVLESDPLVKHFSGLLARKFPDMPPDVPNKPLKGMPEFKERATEIKTALKESYETFIDVVQFKREAWEVLKTCCTELLVLSYKTNTDITADFLSVLTQYIKMHILVTRVQDRKLMICAYARAFHYSAGNTEPNYNDVSAFFVAYDQKLFKKLQEDCAVISDQVGTTISEFWEPIKQWSNKDNLVKERVFSILETPETLTKPQNEDHHLLLMQYNDMCEWTLYGFLVCPLGLQKRKVPVAKKEKEIYPLALQLLQKVLSNVFTITVFRDETLDIHKEYEILFGYYRGPKPQNKKEKRFVLSKYKKVLKQAKEDWRGCLSRHADLRTYLRVEMETLMHFFTRYPSVLCPKFQMVLALMHLTRDEILWYFLHHEGVLPHGCSAKKYEHKKDIFIGALIHLTLKLIDIVKKYQTEIQHYYMGYLMNKDVVRAKEIVTVFLKQTKLSSRDRELTNFLMDTLESGQVNNFESVRLNWYRISASISNQQSGVTTKVTKDISEIMTRIVHRSRNVDCLDSQLRTHGSFQNLYYYRGDVSGKEIKGSTGKNWDQFYSLSDCLKETMTVGNGYSPSFCLSLVKVFMSALHNVHRLCPEEHSQITKNVTKLGDSFLRHIVNKGIESPIRGIIASHEKFLDAQTSTRQVIKRMAQAEENKTLPEEEKKTIPDPGYESAWTSRIPDVRRMKIDREFIGRVCGAFAESAEIRVAHIEFIPREYMIASASANIDNYLRQYTIPPARRSDDRSCTRDNPRRGIEELGRDKFEEKFYLARPSSIIEKFKNVIYAYSTIEQHVQINTSDIVRECLLREFYDDTLVGMCGQGSEAMGATETPKKGAPEKKQIPLIKFVSTWYKKLFHRDIGMELDVRYSPVYQSFFTELVNKGKHSRMLVDGTHYTSFTELNSLCTLIGPYGVRAIDKDILSIVVEEVQAIKDILRANKKRFHQLKDQFTERPLWIDAKNELTFLDKNDKKQESALDNLVKHATKAGCALIFRRLLKDALNRVSNNTVPFITKSVQLAFKEAHQQISIDEKHAELAPLDYLADDCGIDTTDNDRALYDCLKCFKTSDGDRDLWHLLPEAFGISYVCKRWRHADYDVHSDSHNNNVRTIAECFYHLTLIFERITLKSESREGRTDPEISIQQQLERFVTNSAYSVLHMQHKDSMSTLKKGENLTHIMLFLEQFITVSNGRLKLSFLEECFPYTTLRENYIELFHQKELNIHAEEEEKKEEEKKSNPAGENAGQEGSTTTTTTTAHSSPSKSKSKTTT